MGIGVDTLSPEDDKSKFAIHKLMLGNDKYMIENLNYNCRLLHPS